MLRREAVNAYVADASRGVQRARGTSIRGAINLLLRREYLSMAHIWSACFFSRSAKKLEQSDDGLPERTQRHSAFVTAATGAAEDLGARIGARGRRDCSFCAYDRQWAVGRFGRQPIRRNRTLLLPMVLRC